MSLVDVSATEWETPLIIFWVSLCIEAQGPLEEFPPRRHLGGNGADVLVNSANSLFRLNLQRVDGWNVKRTFNAYPSHGINTLYESDKVPEVEFYKDPVQALTQLLALSEHHVRLGWEESPDSRGNLQRKTFYAKLKAPNSHHDLMESGFTALYDNQLSPYIAFIEERDILVTRLLDFKPSIYP